jgi:L-ascorbate metabolism protein UlaG (beta-lactamase superfamily)
MNITHIRNATQLMTYAGKRFLIDPMLAPKGAYPGFPARRAQTFATRWSNCRLT